MSGIEFAGIANPHKLGKYSVEDNGKLLLKYRYLHEHTMRAAAGLLPAMEDWDVKAALGKHIYEDAEAVDAIRNRVLELRTSSAVLDKEQGIALRLFFEELIHAHNDLELLVGIYGLLKPAMLALYRQHIVDTQQLVDQPTIRVLKMIISDLDDQVTWGKSMIAELTQRNVYPSADAFRQQLKVYLDAAGGIDGKGIKTVEIPRRSRSHQPFQLSSHAKRDQRTMGPTTSLRTGLPNPPLDPVLLNLQEKMKVRQEEMAAAELIAAVLYAQQQMPWAFYRALARHLWDEVRHALFGQAALEAEHIEWKSLPQYVGAYDPLIDKIPALRYTLLTIGVEEKMMKRPGKAGEFEFCRDEAKHPLMAQFQDYDWADEVTHAAFGRKWTPELLGEDIEFVRQVAAYEVEERNKHFAMLKEALNHVEQNPAASTTQGY
jgi:hypothetical protein